MKVASGECYSTSMWYLSLVAVEGWWIDGKTNSEVVIVFGKKENKHKRESELFKPSAVLIVGRFKFQRGV